MSGMNGGNVPPTHEEGMNENVNVENTRSFKLDLIKVVKGHRVLWDKSHPHFRDRNKAHHWRRVAEEMNAQSFSTVGRPVEAHKCQAVFKMLYDTLRSTRRRMKEGQKMTNWDFWVPMKFITDELEKHDKKQSADVTSELPPTDENQRIQRILMSNMRGDDIAAQRPHGDFLPPMPEMDDKEIKTEVPDPDDPSHLFKAQKNEPDDVDMQDDEHTETGSIASEGSILKHQETLKWRGMDVEVAKSPKQSQSPQKASAPERHNLEFRVREEDSSPGLLIDPEDEPGRKELKLGDFVRHMSSRGRAGSGARAKKTLYIRTRTATTPPTATQQGTSAHLPQAEENERQLREQMEMFMRDDAAARRHSAAQGPPRQVAPAPYFKSYGSQTGPIRVSAISAARQAPREMLRGMRTNQVPRIEPQCEVIYTGPSGGRFSNSSAASDADSGITTVSSNPRYQERRAVEVEPLALILDQRLKSFKDDEIVRMGFEDELMALIQKYSKMYMRRMDKRAGFREEHRNNSDSESDMQHNM